MYVCLVREHACEWVEASTLGVSLAQRGEEAHEFRVSSVQLCRIPFSSMYMPYVSEGRTVSLMVTLSLNIVIVSC